MSQGRDFANGTMSGPGEVRFEVRQRRECRRSLPLVNNPAYGVKNHRIFTRHML